MNDFGIKGESIICFAGEDWWYHHPHSKNHILKRLARQNKVLFVNSITMGMPSVSSPDFFMKVRRKLKSYMRGLKKVPEGLWVMTPVSVPLFGSRGARFVNRVLLNLQIRMAMAVIGMGKPIIWAAIPAAADVVESLDSKLVLYQVSDKYDANEDSALDKQVIRDLDLRLKKLASVVMYSGRKLYEESDAHHRYFLEQAVDFDHFSTAAPQPARDIAEVPRPILGYFGAMDHVMDAELIAEIARRRPDWHWAFIGLKSNAFNVAAPNVHFLGSKTYAELPSYFRQFDVCVLPWKQSNAFTSYGSAIKVREYLATGKPVVISPLYEYLKTPGVRIYHDADEFISLVEDALAKDSAADVSRRQSAVKDGTWDARAREVAGLILRGLHAETSSSRISE